MINIYFPTELYDKRYRGQLFPLLKPFIKGAGFSDKDRLDMYHISYSDMKIVKEISLADRVILPMSWNYYSEKNNVDKAILFIKNTKKYNKKVLSFASGDFGVKTPNLDNLIVMRQSGERSKLPKSHIGISSFIEDPLKKQFNKQTIFINNYVEKPRIGFCGQTNSSILNAFKEVTKITLRNIKSSFNLNREQPQKIQSTTYLRSKVLDKIKNAVSLENRFVERKKYRAGAITKEQKEQSTKEFYNNIKDTDYTVCVRGAGNFSVRLYETLAMGRIPIFINTDCILPLPDDINWKQHMVWIERSEIHLIKEKIMQFHSLLTPKTFIDLQQSNRKLWEEKLTLGGFFKTTLN